MRIQVLRVRITGTRLGERESSLRRSRGLIFGQNMSCSHAVPLTSRSYSRHSSNFVYFCPSAPQLPSASNMEHFKLSSPAFSIKLFKYRFFLSLGSATIAPGPVSSGNRPLSLSVGGGGVNGTCKALVCGLLSGYESAQNDVRRRERNVRQRQDGGVALKVTFGRIGVEKVAGDRNFDMRHTEDIPPGDIVSFYCPKMERTCDEKVVMQTMKNSDLNRTQHTSTGRFTEINYVTRN